MRLISIAAKNYRALEDVHLAFCTGEEFPWEYGDVGLDYKDDRTQWVPAGCRSTLKPQSQKSWRVAWIAACSE